MIASTPPSKRILDLLVPRMSDLGYSYQKKWHRFIKPFAHGTQEFTVNFDARGGLLSIGGGFFLHFTKLEALFEKATGLKSSWVAGASLSNAGVRPRQYDVFVSMYAALTPKQKAAVDPELVHPQERIEGAVNFILDVHGEHTLPFFEKVQSYRQLSDMLMDGLRGNRSNALLSPRAPDAVAYSLLLLTAFGEDTRELYDIVESKLIGYNKETAQGLIAMVAEFIAKAGPEDLILDYAQSRATG